MLTGAATIILSASWIFVLCLGLTSSDDSLEKLSPGDDTVASSNHSRPPLVPYRPTTNASRAHKVPEKKLEASKIRESLFSTKVPSVRRAIIPSRVHEKLPPKKRQPLPFGRPSHVEKLNFPPPLVNKPSSEYEKEDFIEPPPFVSLRNEGLPFGYKPKFEPWTHTGKVEHYRANVRAHLGGYFDRFPQEDFDESAIVESEKDNEVDKTKVLLILAPSRDSDDSEEEDFSEEATTVKPFIHPDRWIDTLGSGRTGLPAKQMPRLLPLLSQSRGSLPRLFQETFGHPSTKNVHGDQRRQKVTFHQKDETDDEDEDEDEAGEKDEHCCEESHKEMEEEDGNDHHDEENHDEEEDENRPRIPVRTYPHKFPFPVRRGYDPHQHRDSLRAYNVPFMLKLSEDEFPTKVPSSTTKETTTSSTTSTTTPDLHQEGEEDDDEVHEEDNGSDDEVDEEEHVPERGQVVEDDDEPEHDEEDVDNDDDESEVTAIHSASLVNSTNGTIHNETEISSVRNLTLWSVAAVNVTNTTLSSLHNITSENETRNGSRVMERRDAQLISDDGKTFTTFKAMKPSFVKDQHLTLFDFPEKHKVVKHVIPDQQVLSPVHTFDPDTYKAFYDAHLNDVDELAFSNIPRSRKVRTKREVLQSEADSNVHRLMRIREVKDRLEQERKAQETARQRAVHDAQVKQDQHLLRQIFDGEMEADEDEADNAESLQFDAEDDDGEEDKQFQGDDDDGQTADTQFQGDDDDGKTADTQFQGDDDDGKTSDTQFQDDDDGTQNQADEQFQDDDDGTQAQQLDDDDDGTAEQKRNQEDNVQLQNGDDDDGRMRSISEDNQEADVALDNDNAVQFQDDDYQNDQQMANEENDEQFQDDDDGNFAFQQGGAQPGGQNSTSVVVIQSPKPQQPSLVVISTGQAAPPAATTMKKPVWEQQVLMDDDGDDGNTLLDDDDDDGQQLLDDDDDGETRLDDDDDDGQTRLDDDDDGETMADDDDDGEEEVTEEKSEVVEESARLYDQPATAAPTTVVKKETRKEKNLKGKAAKENSIWAHLGRRGGAQSVVSKEKPGMKPPSYVRTSKTVKKVEKVPKAPKKPKAPKSPKTTKPPKPTEPPKKPQTEMDTADTADVQEDINFIREVAVLGPLFPPGTQAIVQPGRGRPHHRSVPPSHPRAPPSSLHHRRQLHPPHHSHSSHHSHRSPMVRHHPSHPHPSRHHKPRTHKRHRHKKSHEEIRNILTLNINLNSATPSKTGNSPKKADVEFGKPHTTNTNKEDKIKEEKTELVADLKSPSEKETVAKVQTVVQADKKREEEEKMKKNEVEKQVEKEEEKIVEQNDKTSGDDGDDDNEEEEEEKEDFLDKEIKQNHVAANPQLDMDNNAFTSQEKHKRHRRTKHAHRAQLDDDDDDGRTRRVQRDVMFDGEPETVAIKLGSINGDGLSRRRKRVLPI